MNIDKGIVRGMLGGAWPEAGGFCFDAVDHFEVRDGAVQGIAGGEPIGPGFVLMLAPDELDPTVRSPQFPKTADGVAITAGMVVYRPLGGADAVASTVRGFTKTSPDEPWWIECASWRAPATDCYSSLDAAITGATR